MNWNKEKVERCALLFYTISQVFFNGTEGDLDRPHALFYYLG
jgi:hypothetical protein